MTTHKEIMEEVTRLVSEGVSVTLPVDGRSMLPFIVGGRESVILRKPGHLKKGDIVLAWVDGTRYVVHRIIDIDGEDIILMGDGNLVATERCTAADIKALATHTVADGANPHYLYTPGRRWAAWLWGNLLPVRRYLLQLISMKHKILYHKTIKA